MKKIFTIAAILLIAFSGKAQNVQFHHDFGSALNDDLDGRPATTTTVEMFKPDKWGSTFFFVDMDYNSKGVQGAYWEIARELKFWEGPLSAHVEYNGGRGVYPYNNAYLAGITFTHNSADFSKGFSIQAMYKYIQKSYKPNNFQLTGTWYLHFAKGAGTFSGFADLWRENTDMIFLAEPQIWLNFNKLKGVDPAFNLSFGSEVEVSNNFVWNKFGEHNKFYVNPTLALKWSFN